MADAPFGYDADGAPVPDQATQDILKEMGTWQQTLDQKSNPAQKDEKDQKTTPPASTPAAKPEPAAKPGEQQGKKPDVQPEQRRRQFVPLAKFRDMEERNKAEIDRLTNLLKQAPPAGQTPANPEDQHQKPDQLTAEQITAEAEKLARGQAKELAAEGNIDEDLAYKLALPGIKLALQAANRGITLPADIQQKLDRLAQLEPIAGTLLEQQDRRDFDKQFSEVSKEFLEKNPHLSDPAVQQEIYELSETEGYESTPLRAVVAEYLIDNPPDPHRATVEQGQQGHGRRASRTKSDDEVTADDLSGMDPADVVAYGDRMAARERAR